MIIKKIVGSLGSRINLSYDNTPEGKSFSAKEEL